MYNFHRDTKCNIKSEMIYFDCKLCKYLYLCSLELLDLGWGDH